MSEAERGAARPAPIITIDGPAGSGKSSTAKEVARRLGFRHLDSGALYRAITVALLDAGIPVDEWASLVPRDLDALGVELTRSNEGFGHALRGTSLEGRLREPAVNEHVSRVAALPAVRSWLLGFQRRAGAEGGLVADGRDMGTVVFPDADLKVFLVADLEERARRRLLQEGKHSTSDRAVAEEASRIANRDRLDQARDLSPLQRPPDAVEIDTTSLRFEEQVERIVARATDLTRS